MIELGRYRLMGEIIPVGSESAASGGSTVDASN
jgi:hypothetical protein